MTPQSCQEIVGGLRRAFGDGLITAALFGSRARDDFDASSDVDIFVIAETLPERHYERRVWINERMLSSGMPPGCSVLAKTKAEFLSGFPPLYLDLGLDAQVIYDTDDFLMNHLRRIRDIIRKAGLVREKMGRSFLWRWRTPPRGEWTVDWSGYRES